MALIDDLVSYWKLDEASGDAIDSHGSNSLTAVGTPGTAAGKIGSARTFPTGASLERASNDSLQFGEYPWTLSCWIYPTTDSGRRVFCHKYSTSGFYLELRNDNRVMCYVGDAVSNIHSTILSEFQWFFVVARYEPGTLSLTVDGTTEHFVESAAESNATFVIGTFLTRYFLGRIDEVGKWSRRLSDDEITQLYNAGNGLAYPFSVQQLSHPFHSSPFHDSPFRGVALT